MISAVVDVSDLDRLNASLLKVAALGRRAPAEIIQRAAADIVLGSKGTGAGGGAFPGLFSSLVEIAPERGEATREAEARDWRVKRSSPSYNLGRLRAEAMLGGDTSGVFSVKRGDRGRMETPQRVFTRTRGKRAGQFYAHTGRARLAKSAVPAAGKTPGFSTLNVHALATAFAIAYRERARGATAAQFLPKPWRRALLRRNPAKADAAAAQAFSANIPAKNKKGSIIGELDLALRDTNSHARIRGSFGVPSRYADRVTRVVRSVTFDREAYLLGRDMRAMLKKGGSK